jgi:hypothetical protein
MWSRPDVVADPSKADLRTEDAGFKYTPVPAPLDRKAPYV